MRARVVTLATTILVAAVMLTPVAPAATQPKPKPVVLAYTITNGKVVKGNKRPSVKKGKLVRIVVVANRGEELHLHGYDLERTVRPGKETVILFTAKVPGRFELELHHPDVVVARLSVTP